MSHTSVKRVPHERHWCNTSENIFLHPYGGNLHKFDLYLGVKKILKKEKEFFFKKIEQSYCAVYFFNSPMFYDKLFDKCIYGVTTVRSGRKKIPQRKNDKQMKRGDVDFKYSDNVLCFK